MLSTATPTPHAADEPFVEVGSFDTIYGRIYLRPRGRLVYTGDAEMLRMIVDECRYGDAPSDGAYRRLTNAEVFETLPRRLRGMTWAWRGPEEDEQDED